jgi:type II secretory pathway component PulJ
MTRIRTQLRSRTRRGISLLEVTIGTMLASMIAIMAAGVSVDVTRHMADNIAETKIAGEARLAIEALRRDFSGSSLDETAGDPATWRLVGRMIPTANELRLCFDANRDASADWIAPDRVVTYTQVGDRLVRSDQVSGNSYTVARYVDDVQFIAAGGKITVLIDFAFASTTESYTIETSDIP